MMKRYMLYVIVLMIILNIVFFPKKDQMNQYIGVENQVDLLEVHVGGEVLFPGTYYLYEPMTYLELIDRAGGLTSDADQSQISFQKIISTSTTIHIASKLDEDTQVNILVNINEASFSELLEIPGMTETRAANLIIYRREHGAFTSIDDLILVSYIGTQTLEKIRPYITL